MLLLKYNPTRRALTLDRFKAILEVQRISGKRDLHSLIASWMFNAVYEHVTPQQRAAAKQAAFFYLYDSNVMNQVAYPASPRHWVQGIDKAAPEGEWSTIAYLKGRKVYNSSIQSFNAGLADISKLEAESFFMHELAPMYRTPTANEASTRAVTVTGRSPLTSEDLKVILLKSRQMGIRTLKAREEAGEFKLNLDNLKLSYADLERRVMDHVDRALLARWSELAPLINRQLSARENAMGKVQSLEMLQQVERRKTPRFMVMLDSMSMYDDLFLRKAIPKEKVENEMDEKPKQKFAKALMDSKKAKANKKPSGLLLGLMKVR